MVWNSFRESKAITAITEITVPSELEAALRKSRHLSVRKIVAEKMSRFNNSNLLFLDVLKSEKVFEICTLLMSFIKDFNNLFQIVNGNLQCFYEHKNALLRQAKNQLDTLFSMEQHGNEIISQLRVFSTDESPVLRRSALILLVKMIDDENFFGMQL